MLLGKPGDRAALVSYRATAPTVPRRQAGLAGQSACPPQPAPAFKARKVHGIPALAGAKRVPHAHTHAAHMCPTRSRVPNHHSPRTLTHYAPTQCTVHAPCACTHVQRHLYTPLYMHTMYAHTRTFPEVHTTYLQPQGITITYLGLPKATQGAECKPACSHTHGHLLKTGAEPESHNS